MARRACLAVVAFFFLLRGPLLFKHAFDPDEFQHLHSAWCIGQGLVPYRDYFDHHTPWLHLLLAPALRAARVEQDSARAVAAVFAARALMWGLSGVILWLTYRLGAVWRGPATGWLAAALLALLELFPDKTLEIRPDVPACAALVACWVVGLEGRRPFVAGLLGGAAVMFTPKALFAIPGAAVPLLLVGSGAAAAFAAGVALPGLVTLAGFGAAGASRDFVTSTLLVNVAWKTRFSPLPVLAGLAYDNTAIVALAALGLLLCVRRAMAARLRGDLLLALETLALLAGGFVIPIPYAQYFLPLLPLIALLAADAMTRLLESLPSARRGGALALALALLSLGPLSVVANILSPRNTRVADKLHKLRYAMSEAAPGESFLDGFSGLGVFRPHAFRYFFLHDEMRAELGEAPIAALVNGLRDGVIAPTLVSRDADLRAVSRELDVFLDENYEPTPEAPLVKRRELWLGAGELRLDLGGGPAAVLVGRGWRAPEQEGDVTFRRSRGGFATLRVPVRKAGRLRLELLARAASGASAQVLLNDVVVGQLRLDAAWRQVGLDCMLRAGVNALRLGLSDAGDGPREISVAWLRALPPA